MFDKARPDAGLLFFACGLDACPTGLWCADRFRQLRLSRRGDLAGENGGQGFSGAWFEGGFNVSVALTTVASGPLSYPLLSTPGNSLTTPATSSLNGIERNLASPVSSGTIYLSCLLTPEGTLSQGNGGGFFGLYLHGTGNDLFMGGGSNAPYSIGLRGGADTTPSSSQEVLGQTEFLVLMAQLNTSGNDVFTLYTDPTPGASTAVHWYGD